MLKQELDYAIEKGLIDLETRRRIEIYDKRLSRNNLPIIYNLRHLRKILKINKKEQENLFGKERDCLYKEFYIPKKSGGYRKIEAPVDRLKSIQKWIKNNILDNFVCSVYAKGFVKNESIYTNALPHVGKELVVNLDLKDFFPTIKYENVFRLFNYFGYTKDVSHELTKLCTNAKNELPQGSPASPVISNLVCLKLDKRLSVLANNNNFSYTRYADDITFSGNGTLKYYLKTIYKIINEEGFVINDKKTRFQYSYQRQEVTGLIVNKKIAITKCLKKELENAIYYCKKHGVIEHMQRINCNRAFYKEHLYGIACFIRMIDEQRGINYMSELDKIDWIY